MKNDTTIHADEPIDSKSKDSLGRSRLVEIVTRHVLATDEKHSMVIGLNAPWGAGKSSFLNLLQNHLLAKENPSPPIVIRFNPWLYKDIDQITYSFFDELARGIGMGKENEKKKEKKKEIVKNLKSLGKLTTGIASPFFPRSTIWLSNLIDYIPSPDAPTLVESREKLNSSLGELDQRVVVLIDDLDRMEKDSVLTLLKMVRLNANLANITYVLAFDRQIIEKQLDEENGISGRNYLDKIVQLPFDLPAPEPEIINGILFGHIYEVIESSETREWNQNRWRQISIAGFGYHFQTIRQVKRYTNALQTRLSAIREEVDPVDFIAIELVRVFHPDAYQEIAEAGALLTGKWTKQGDISLMMDDGDKLEEAKEQFLKRVRNNSSNNLRDTVVEILKRVFPRLHSTSYDDSSHAQWSRECRICSPDHFDKYFSLDIPPKMVSAVAMDAFLSSLNDIETTITTLHHFASDERASAFLKRLSACAETLPEEKATSLLKALCEAGDSFDFDDVVGFFEGADVLVFRVIYRCLLRIPTEEVKFNLLLSVITEGQAICTIVDMVKTCLRWEGEVPPLLLDDNEKQKKIRDAALERIRLAYQNGGIWDVRDVPMLLYLWREWGNEDDVRVAIAGHVGKDENLVAFISKYKSKGLSSSSGEHWTLPRDYFTSILDLNTAMARLRTIATQENELGQQAQELVGLLEADPWR